ncbi:hypothetical protein [Agromyces sp. Soil535]|uniref:hypothetical protein n=1 Tax=Agromyces sp. Soil535 TaxID=1736390 RepID=UPI0006FD05C3|nr:hypothetical protein [Agromyces sp. Soil535]KRE31176.1 hypothetical protein ASG80_01535 [Agromyces sp. Soil535]
MQHSADFTSLLGYQADVARAEREIEFRRAAAERRALEPEPASAASGLRRRRQQRTTRLALR